MMAQKVPVKEALEVVKAVSLVYQVSPSEVFGRRRFASIAEARQCAMTVLRNRGYTFESIGRAFSRDHGTVVHASRKCRDRIDVDRKFRDRWEAITARLNNVTGKATVKIEFRAIIPGHLNWNDEEVGKTIFRHWPFTHGAKLLSIQIARGEDAR